MIRIILIFSIILFVGNAKAQENANIYKTIFWQVTKEGIRDTSYIFGSCHAFTSRFFLYHPGIIDKLYKTKIFAPETDYSTVPLGIKSFEVPDSVKLVNLATKKQFRRIKQFLHYYYLTNKKYLEITDIYTALAIFETNATKYYIGNKYENYNSNDMFIDDYCKIVAKKNANLIIGLEEPVLHSTYIKNLSCNCKIPTIDQMKIKIDYLDSLIKLVSVSPSFYEPSDTLFLKNYFEMNLNYYLDTIPEESEFSENIKTRNKLWIPTLEALFSSKSTFVDVGIAHLFFKFGLINLLREKGYKVEPLSIK